MVNYNKEVSRAAAKSAVIRDLLKYIEDDDILTTVDLARLLSTRKENVRRWCKNGDLPTISVQGHHKVRGKELKRFLQSKFHVC
jgi:hypothetical protein